MQRDATSKAPPKHEEESGVAVGMEMKGVEAADGSTNHHSTTAKEESNARREKKKGRITMTSTDDVGEATVRTNEEKPLKAKGGSGGRGKAMRSGTQQEQDGNVKCAKPGRAKRSQGEPKEGQGGPREGQRGSEECQGGPGKDKEDTTGQRKAKYTEGRGKKAISKRTTGINEKTLLLCERTLLNTKK
jgi:hypothetical protein